LEVWGEKTWKVWSIWTKIKYEKNVLNPPWGFRVKTQNMKNISQVLILFVFTVLSPAIIIVLNQRKSGKEIVVQERQRRSRKNALEKDLLKQEPTHRQLPEKADQVSWSSKTSWKDRHYGKLNNSGTQTFWFSIFYKVMWQLDTLTHFYFTTSFLSPDLDSNKIDGEQIIFWGLLDLQVQYARRVPGKTVWKNKQESGLRERHASYGGIDFFGVPFHTFFCQTESILPPGRTSEWSGMNTKRNQ